MTSRIALALLFCVGASPAIAQTEAPNASSDEIIVTGTPLENSGLALAECLAKGCPPEEDMRLSLEHAENQFVAGVYKDGASTLNKSISRNKKHRGEYPVLLSGLYRASGRFAEHLGEADDFKFATLNMQDTLEDAFGKDDPKVLIAQTEVGDSRAKLGSVRGARDSYRAVERRALELGQYRVATFARMRLALLMRLEWNADRDNSALQRRYEESLAQLINEPLENSEDFSMVARVLQARLDNTLGRPDAIENLIKVFVESGGTDTPVLLSEEPIRNSEFRNYGSNGVSSSGESNTLARLTTPQLNTPRFVDVGFYIQPDGTTNQIEVLRSQGPTRWHDALIKNIDSRIYAPLNIDPTSPGRFHIERYTLTARFADITTSTRIRQREPNFRVERLDLTPENYGDMVTKPS